MMLAVLFFVKLLVDEKKANKHHENMNWEGRWKQSERVLEMFLSLMDVGNMRNI